MFWWIYEDFKTIEIKVCCIQLNNVYMCSCSSPSASAGPPGPETSAGAPGTPAEVGAPSSGTGAGETAAGTEAPLTQKQRTWPREWVKN